MKARITKTKIWSDSKVEALSKDAKFLFVYLLINEYIGLTGAYEISDHRIMFNTKLTSKELEIAKKALEKSELAYFLDGWVVIPNTEKHNSYRSSPVTRKAYDDELAKLPEEIMKLVENSNDNVENPRVSIPSNKGMHTHRNKKTEIRNKKTENRNKKNNHLASNNNGLEQLRAKVASLK